MKVVNVVAAIIAAEDKEGRKIVFATQRGYGEFKGGVVFQEVNTHKCPFYAA